MKNIIYAGTEVLTGDDIALALLRFGEALARIGSAEMVEIPVLRPDGSRGTAMILIGPSSQIVTVDDLTGAPELVDAAAVARLEDKTRHVVPLAEPIVGPPERDEWVEEF